MYFRKILLMLLAVCCLHLPAAAAGITHFDKFITPDYWTEHNPNGDKPILDADGVTALNAKLIANCDSMVDLANYPASVSGASLRPRLADYEILDDELYRNGVLVSDNYKNILRSQTNISALPETATVRYGLALRKTNVRNLPTNESLFYTSDDSDFDVLQETVLDPLEPVAVLHESANGFFYYVQSLHYAGWLSRLDVALVERDEWLSYVAPQKFLVVTGREILVKTGAEQIRYQQGARLPYAALTEQAYLLRVPIRGKDGNPAWEEVQVAKDNPDIHEGYLPYTSNNIVRSAFKWYDAPYGWGGRKDSVDCSSLLYNAYRTMGVRLPRNADEQEAAAAFYRDFNGMTEEQRLGAIRVMKPGTALFMDGHVVLYLGTSNAVPFVIHSLGSYYEDGQRQPVLKVVVSDLSLERSNGASFLNSLTGAAEYR